MNKYNLTIVIADDHPLMLKGLYDELVQANYTIIGTAPNGNKAVELIATLNPDIALLDIEMPFLNGFEVMKQCLQLSVKTKYIVMTYHKEKGFLVQAKKVGVHGYLLKEDSLPEIENCIKAVMNDETYFSQSFDENIDHTVNKELRKIALLSPSERTIIRLIAQDKNSSEISEVLQVSRRTIEKHRTNM